MSSLGLSRKWKAAYGDVGRLRYTVSKATHAWFSQTAETKWYDLLLQRTVFAIKYPTVCILHPKQLFHACYGFQLWFKHPWMVHVSHVNSRTAQ